MPKLTSKLAILPQNKNDCQVHNWQNNMRQSLTFSEQLPKHTNKNNFDENSQFSMKIPLNFSKFIDFNNKNDPLLQQVLPTLTENTLSTGFQLDPTADLSQQPIPGLLHKYRGRALLITTGACAIHCRYCFRRHFPYSENQSNQTYWPKIISYLEHQRDIHEIILSGGDPFTLSDEKLLQILEDIEKIPHIKTIRFHTRMLSFMPERINNSIQNWLDKTTRNIVFVFHINHANELNPEFKFLCQSLRSKRVTLLNQSVLLLNVNDNLGTLTKLSQGLFEFGILPYYLHQLDKVVGAAHFMVPIQQAKSLHNQLKDQLPGYLVPKFVFEEAHAKSKQWL
jgi:L-lysine 2,3-aminomutase